LPIYFNFAFLASGQKWRGRSGCPFSAMFILICPPVCPIVAFMGVGKVFIWFTQHPERAKQHAGKRVAIVDDEVIAPPTNMASPSSSRV
jgi:hypothetical protein